MDGTVVWQDGAAQGGASAVQREGAVEFANVTGSHTFAFGTVTTDVPGTVGGSVPATLSLSLGTPAAFGAFTPGVAKDYFASTTANVISTAGDATLSVADPSSNATGHLVNGAFSLPQPLQARARNAANTGTAYNNVGSSASPLNLLTWSAPVSNDALTLEFKQSIGANDPLRTGTYSKSLTFTLSTTPRWQTDAPGGGGRGPPRRRDEDLSRPKLDGAPAREPTHLPDTSTSVFVNR